jgi:glycosyltransferase involved in cell wall biosynthesis
MFDYNNKMKINSNLYELQTYRPYWGEYIWSFVFKKEKLMRLLEKKNETEWNKFIDDEFKEVYAFGNLLYFHNKDGKQYLKNKDPLVDKKETFHFKNLFYMGDGCNGAFNGYISWLNNIGRCFGNKYELTILYDNMPDKTRRLLSKYFSVIKRERTKNYTTDVLLVTYATYFYPKNIFALESNHMFIHGNMSDYEHAARYTDDIYTDYIAVSKIAAKKAKGYFPSKEIKSIINPFKLDKTLVQPHLRLVSALRYSPEKAPERIEALAKIFDELQIPFTWNVFTDQKENTVESNGLIFRSRVYNPLPYINDSDYFVLLSNTEAMPYCILEAMALNTKLVVTPLDAYKELGIKNGKNAIVIPFSYFEEKNKNKLIGIAKKMYKEKQNQIKYTINQSLWKDYNKILKK